MLALSTATKKTLIALDYNGKQIFKELDADCRQSEKLLFAIDEMLKNEKITLKEVGNFALIIGPGSFTGLRIGAALIKGFCAGDPSHKVVSLPTLDLIAHQVIEQYSLENNFTCVMNAQSGKFYVASYTKKGKRQNNEHIETAADILKNKGAKYCLLEEGFLPNAVTITCQSLLSLALEREKKGDLITAKELVLKYIRKSSAEEKIL